ncbi:C-type lectin domain family 4 member C-like [Aotus nancymaae]|uniref:C-type lectin domain family 4 member C-like n=1 Tax=Aotus nancymaae TaxID=37293 RepID=UPI0030FE84DC
MLPEQEPQDREKGIWRFQVKVWSVAVVSILLLTACFTVSSAVTHHFMYSKTAKRLSKLQDHQQYHPSLTCITEGKDIEGLLTSWEIIVQLCPGSETAYSLMCRARERFWHSDEPNNLDERCVVINFRSSEEWGWNDVHCHVPQNSICKMKKIYI